MLQTKNCNYFFSVGFEVEFGAAGLEVLAFGVVTGALLGVVAGAFAGNVLGSATSDLGTFLFLAGA